MTIDKRTYRRLLRLTAWAFLIAAGALWIPLSWQSRLDRPGTHIDLDFGAMKPLRATWQSSADGFWFAFSGLRGGEFLLSAVLTAGAAIAAREMDRRSRAAPMPA
jgi:hypothetical protein